MLALPHFVTGFFRRFVPSLSGPPLTFPLGFRRGVLKPDFRILLLRRCQTRDFGHRRVLDWGCRHNLFIVRMGGDGDRGNLFMTVVCAASWGLVLLRRRRYMLSCLSCGGSVVLEAQNFFDSYSLILGFLLGFFTFDVFMMGKVLEIFRVIVGLVGLCFRCRMELLCLGMGY